MGSEQRNPSVSLEYQIATTWLLRVGILATVLCVAYFLMWSIERNLLPPVVRVAGATIFGCILLVSGLRLLRGVYRLIGQGFLGGGLLVLYFSAFAAGPMYGLIGTSPTFLFMILVTCTAGVIAVRTESQLIAILGLVGGFFTPVIIRTPEPNLFGLYSYMTLLNLGILGVAIRKEWRLLNYLSCLSTFALFGVSLFAYTHSDFMTTIVFLSIFFILHASLSWVHSIIRNQASTVLEILQLIVVTGVYSLFSYGLVESAHGRPWPALIAFGLAVYFIAHVYAFLQRRCSDRMLLTTLLGLSGACTVWIMPLAFEKETLTAALAVLAALFVWIGRRLGSNTIRTMGDMMYAVVLWRVLFYDLPRGFIFGNRVETYWQEASERFWTFGIVLLSFFFGSRIPARPQPDSEFQISSQNNWPTSIGSDAVRHTLLFWTWIGASFLYLQLESYSMFRLWPLFNLPVLTAIYCLYAAYSLYRVVMSKGKESAFIIAFSIFAVGAIIKLLAFDLRFWQFGAYGVMHALSLGETLVRITHLSLLPCLMAGAWFVFHKKAPNRNLATIYGTTGIVLLFICSSFEWATFLSWHLPLFQRGGLSAWWAVFASALITAGIWKDIRPMRFCGLALSTLVILKIFLNDFTGMPTVFRMIAFLIVGVVMLFGSFAYIRANRLTRETPPPPSTNPQSKEPECDPEKLD